MKDFKNILKRLKDSKVIDYKILQEALGHKLVTALDKEAELVFKLCEWRYNDRM